MAKSITLTATQKEEVRRLTQLANRRIKAAQRAYAKEGMGVLPRDVTGNYQVKEQWATKNTPISRSVRFQSEEQYKRHIKELRSFERERPGIKDYTNVQRDKTVKAMETSLGRELPPQTRKKVEKMSAPQMAEFWNTFSNKASKLGMKYSSEAAMEQTVNELLPGEDMANVTGEQRKRRR